MKKSSEIKKAVIVAAGYGTRFLPATKNQPKEMLPLIDKPIIHYIVEEAVASGITDIILVTKHGNNVMEDYFDNHYELENVLEKAGKTEMLEYIRNIPQLANFVYVRQKKHLPYGNATPLISVKNLIDDDEAFVYMFGDDLTLATKPVTKQLIDIFQEHKPSAVLGVQEVPWEEIDRYASIEYKKNSKYPNEMLQGHEKLPKEQAPSNKAQFGRFVFSYEVIEAVQRITPGKNGELWIIDVLNALAKEGNHVLAPPIKGKWLTTGDPLRYIKTTLEFALTRKDLAPQLLEFLRAGCSTQFNPK